MKHLLRYLAFALMVGVAYSQGSCGNSEYKNNCVAEGRYGSETYFGEWVKGKPFGVGRMTSDQRVNSGQIKRYGVWIDGNLDKKLPENEVENWLEAYRNSKDESSILKSNLPKCEGNYFRETWTNCFGVQEGARGEIYVGEFFQNIRSGLGARYSSKGELLLAGYWGNNNFLNSAQLDIESFKFPYPSQVVTAGPSIQTSSPPQINMNVGGFLTGKRIALVVGNANYKTRPLRNPRNDADDVSLALKASGFQVIDLRDATLQQMRTGVRQFGDRLINNDVGLVYYSGHGVEVKGRNYFIPVNADIMREDEIADQGLDVSLILEKMNTAGKGVNILIVDACRDDPFGRSFRSASRGLAQMDAPRGTIIAYATSPGKVASDGDGRNSPYTKNLVKVMQQPNKPIEQVFKEVRRAVQEETKNQQTPWENTSLSGDFYFKVQR